LQNKEQVIEALRRAKFKLSGCQKIHISKKWGFTKFNADESENMVAEKWVIPDGCGSNMSKKAQHNDFLLLHTAFKKGNNEGMPRAEATTAKARAVVLRTYSSMLSISGLMVEIIVASPAA
ncbi:hypothetical protein Celaphus_00016002, partial [Cervus elaphus hippelaphus]